MGVGADGDYGSVSTHSRPKAAGKGVDEIAKQYAVSTHSRPKAAGSTRASVRIRYRVSTHSRPKAAGAGIVNGLSTWRERSNSLK